MKFSLGWLSEHLQLDDATLIDGLHRVGFPIDAYHDPRLGDAFVVAQVLSITQHPDADKLRVCVVTDGSTERQIVCGDPGVRVGQVTVLALPGARLPCGKEIVRSKIRGVVSEGMLCSGDELGIEEESAGVMSLDAQVGCAADSVLFPDGPEWSIEVVFNRRDMLSVRGIAQEVAALSGAPMIGRAQLSQTGNLDCIASEIAGAMIVVARCNLEGRATPKWMARRLALQGVQAKGLWAVDVTNYVAHDIGHPLHAFDADKLQGVLVARLARAGEQLVVLSGETITLKGGEPVFSDDLGVVSLIGVVGGARTACSASTTSVLFESTYLDRAYFKAGPKLDTHARKLCIRGADLSGPLCALGRVAELCAKHGIVEPAQVVGSVDCRKIFVDSERVQQIIGARVDVGGCLERLGFVHLGDDSWRIPSWRADISIQEDIAEEVARVYGYNNINARDLKYRYQITKPDRIDTLRTALASSGLYEVMNGSIVSYSEWCKEGVRVNDARRLRSSLIPGLYKSCTSQIARRVTQFVGVFEVGTCFGYQPKYGFDYVTESDEVRVYQWQSLGIVLNPTHTDAHDADKYLDLISELLGVEIASDAHAELPVFAHPGIGCCVRGDGCAGWIGALHPKCTYPESKECVRALELRVPIAASGSELAQVACVKTCSQSVRDLTFVCSGHPRDLHVALRHNKPVNSDIRLLYTHGTAMTFRCLVSIDGATQSDIDAVVQQYISAAQSAGAKLQSECC